MTKAERADPLQIVGEFVRRINARDVGGLIELMTENHRLIDPEGTVVSGLANLRQAWTRYFEIMADYSIAVREAVAREEIVILTGEASGVVSVTGSAGRDTSWRIPAAWRAVVRGGRVAEWQVYADNEPVRAVLREVER